MPDEDEAGRQWVVEPPPASGEVAVYVACGEGAALTGEQEAALGALLHSLEVGDADVLGYDNAPACPDKRPISSCNPLRCGEVNCALVCTGLSKGIRSAASSWNLMGSFGSRAM